MIPAECWVAASYGGAHHAQLVEPRIPLATHHQNSTVLPTW